MYGDVTNSQIIECLAVGYSDGYQVFRKRSLSAPRLPQTEDYIGLRRCSVGLHGIFQGG